MLVRGGRSELVPEESARHFMELVPHAEYRDVTEAGHMVAGDRNDAFSSAVVDFLRTLEAV
jgi:pimeloyl-ACP methyl ester carboxylesterase